MIIKEYACSPQTFAREKSVFYNAAMNFTMSRDVRNSIEEGYGCPSDKSVCVYRSTPAKIEYTQIHQSVNITRYDNKNVLFVGFDWERKGGPLLAEAFQTALRIHPDAQLTIVGCDVHLGIKNYHVFGHVPLSEIGCYYENASIFCMPSNLVCCESAYIEAMMYKLPIVATDLGANSDLVTHGENGYLTKPGDVNQLAAALIDLLGDSKKCQIFGEKGYTLAQEKYTWEKVGKKIRENIWEHINTRGGQLPITVARV